MKTIELTIYKFSELTEDSKKVAIDDYRNNNDDTFYYNELKDSINAFCELFNVQTGNSYDDIRTSNIDDNILNLSGVRLYKYLINNFGGYLFKPKFITDIKGHKFLPQFICKRYDFTKHGNGLSTFLYSKNEKTNCCVLTGFCYDNEILEPIYNFLKNPLSSVSFENLFNQVENAISKSFDNIEKWINSDEYIAETLTANDYDFTENGEIY